MAQGILRAILRQTGCDVHTRVISAGTAACSGLPALPYAVAVAAEDGVDISSHSSRPLDTELIAQADLVLAMSPEHVDFARPIAPDETKVTTLKEFAARDRPPLDAYIPDPVGGSLTMYRASFREIKREIERISPEIIRRTDEKRQTSSG
jgi:protein-tyrosine-phosphatase